MGRDAARRAYVVVVAGDKRDTLYKELLIVDGKPDLEKVQAFIAMGNQGIVYEANRWHSPMCALDQVLDSIYW